MLTFKAGTTFFKLWNEIRDNYLFTKSLNVA